MSETTEEQEKTAPETAEVVEDAAAETPEQADADPAAALQAECDSLKDQLLRARAEFDNYRRRMAREMETMRKTAAESLIRDLLPVADNLERGLAHAEDRESPLVKGVEMVMKQFADVLSARGLEPVAGVGEPFDPNVHEALAQQPSEEHPADTVVLEYERGYRLGDQVLRPAKVVVSSGPAAPQQNNEGDSAQA
ncbi:MAG: nucleotide exchange factor GrpE [Candidatus Hydrogenedens sp.]|nr:nucleotide exchange factor GrpE [Candidatus Hydrogenedens sp.]